MDLRHRVALVTGGKRIGRNVALALARGGADVSCVYRSSAGEAEDIAAQIRATGRRAVTIAADLQRPEDCARSVDSTVEALGRVDILVNMASIYLAIPNDDLSVEDWDRQMHVDLRAAWLCARAAVPHMRRLGGGRIINFSDW